MQHRARGRHRQHPRHRRHAPRGRLVLSAGTAHGRTVALNTALGAALFAGMVGGGAAAAADLRGATSVVSSPWPTGISTPTPTPLDMGPDGITSPMPRDSELAPSGWQPRSMPTHRGVTAGLSAVVVRQKPRPVVRSAHAAWVNPNPSAVVTSCFGPRWGRQHEGVDLAAPEDSPIVAAGAGVVVRAGEAGGYGNAVLIDHGNGYLTHYGHLATIGVHVGQRVAAGDQIGEEGSTGHSTGPHLHFEVHEGYYKNPIEPLGWLREHGVDVTGCADSVA